MTPPAYLDGRCSVRSTAANPTVRELADLQYPFGEPFIVDSSESTARLDVPATAICWALVDTSPATAAAE